MYSAFEAPALGLTQIIDKTGTNLSAKVSSAFETIGVSAPKQEQLSTAAWLGRTVGGAIGMMAPLGLLGMGSRGLLSGMAPSLLTERTAIGFSLSESALTGGVYGTVFTPTEGKNLLTERLIGGAGMATSFGLLSGSGLAMSKFATTETAAQLGVRGILQNPISAGVLSGAPAGLINAETKAVQKGDWIFSKDDLGEQMLQMSIVGGLFGAKTQLFGAKAAEAPGRRVVEAASLSARLAVADESSAGEGARFESWQPEMNPEWLMPPAAVASFRARIDEMLERRQRQADIPQLEKQMESLSDDARIKRLELSGRALGLGASPESLKVPDAFNYYHMKAVFGDDAEAHGVYRQLRQLETDRAQLSERIRQEIEERTHELTEIINSAAPSLFPKGITPRYKIAAHDQRGYGVYQGDGHVKIQADLVKTASPKLANTIAHEAKHGEQEALLVRKYIDEAIGENARPGWDDFKAIASLFERRIGAAGPRAEMIAKIYYARDAARLTEEELARANKLEESWSDLVRSGKEDNRNAYRERYHEKEAYAVSSQVEGGPLKWRSSNDRLLSDLRSAP